MLDYLQDILMILLILFYFGVTIYLIYTTHIRFKKDQEFWENEKKFWENMQIKSEEELKQLEQSTKKDEKSQ